MHTSLVSALLLTVAFPAHAFCGLYVGPVDGTLENGSSRVVVARDGDRTTLTMANDVTADVSDFAMVVPVPASILTDSVRLADRDWIDMLDATTAPRRVAYSCDDFRQWDSGYDVGHARGCSGGGCGWGDDKASDSGDAGTAVSTGYGTSIAYDSVVVQAEFAVGAYDVVLLSAEESADLFGWLDQEGYGLPAGAEGVLQEYIDAGLYFLAVKVSLDDVPDGAYLDPIQFAYDSPGQETWSLPTRLGALNSAGVQEVQLFTLTSGTQGQTRVINASPIQLEDECMPPPGSDLETFYGEWLAESFGSVLPGHVVEYAWPGWQQCDPCSPGFETLDPQMLEAFGFTARSVDDHYSEGFDVFLTRVRARYDAGNAVDLQFAPSYETGQTQVRFVDYLPELESTYPICGQGMVQDDPGSCDDAGQSARVSRPMPSPGQRAVWLPLGLLGLATAFRRARRG
ncbi:MAG: hypothetical protein ACI8PZ_006874 [Myxococcota bacterium]|jgi:hypothetical protein